MQDMHVMGVDISSGSPLSRTHRPRYAVVVIDGNGKAIYESVDAPLHRVIRIAWEYRVKRIGIDNVFELAPSSRGVAQILSLLPAEVELYQVTLERSSFESLRKILAGLGIELKSKPRPLYTAYLVALLAMKGVGKPVKAIEHRTRIVVTRARSVGAGGSSAQRFARGMRTAILRVVREIKDSLDRASINYDLIFKRGRGGLERAVFVVYAPREVLAGVVKPFRGNDVVVSIRPEYSRIVLFDEDEEQRKLVVVGIDPGIETGLAVLDLSMRPLLVTSAKELDRSSIINMVYKIGVPVLIATDKSPAPEAVKKVASTLGVPLYVPPKSLSVSEKEQLIEWLSRRLRTSVRVSTTHERDALAAAIRALRVYERKFAELERRLSELGIDVDMDEAKLMLIKGKSIDEVVEIAISRKLEEMGYERKDHPRGVVLDLRRQAKEADKKIKSLESRIEELIREREALREEVKRLRREVEELSFELRHATKVEVSEEVMRDRLVVELREKLKLLSKRLEESEEKVKELRKELARAHEILSDVVKGVVEGVPRARSLRYHDLSTLLVEVARSKGAIFVDRDEADAKGLDILRNLGVAVLMKSCSEEMKRHLWMNGVAVECGAEPVHLSEGYAFFNSSELRELVEKARKALKSFLEELEKQRRRELSLEKLKKIIEEYRREVLENT